MNFSDIRFYVPETDPALLIQQIIQSSPTPLIYVLLLLFGFNWLYATSKNNRLTLQIITWNETNGPRVGFVYQIEYGWTGFRLTPLPIKRQADPESPSKGSQVEKPPLDMNGRCLFHFFLLVGPGNTHTVRLKKTLLYGG